MSCFLALPLITIFGAKVMPEILIDLFVELARELAIDRADE
jgi:hypothetical protein